MDRTVRNDLPNESVAVYAVYVWTICTAIINLR